MISEAAEARLRQAFPVLATASPSLMAELGGAVKELRAPTGTVLFEAGSECRAFPLLLEGQVRVARSAANGREMLLYRMTSGQMCLLTSSCLLASSVYPARAVVEHPAWLLALDPGFFHRLLGRHEGFRQQVFGLFAERMAELMERVDEIAFRRLDARLAALLVARGPMIEASHQALAEELGSVRVVVSRLLGGFEQRGWVELGREQIRVLDADALGKLAHVE